MLRFFSKMRYKLAAENRVAKYLRYAIGEILLVVIGILLALAINNWNNMLKLQNANRSYLKKMLVDLNSTNERLNLLIGTTNNTIPQDYGFPTMDEAVIASDSLLKLTYDGLDKSHFEYLVTARFFQGNSALNINNNTYTELSNTGKLYSLGNEELINDITKYYNRCKRETEYNDSNNETISDGIKKFEDGFGKLFLDYYMDSVNFNLRDYPFYFDPSSPEYKNFQIGLNELWSLQELNMIKMQDLVAETNLLITSIQSELRND